LGAGATPDTRAAWLAAKHAGTPVETILDSLGREVISVSHDRVEVGAGVVRDERHVTFTRLDAEGKPLWIRDPLAHLVMQYLTPPKPDRDDPRVARDFSAAGNPNNDIGTRTPAYDIAGSLLFQHSMDAGDRWTINDAAGKPMFVWDVNERQEPDDTFVAEQRVYATEYDALHRPRATWLRVDDGAATMIERFEYQDAQPNDVDNLNGQLVRHYDPSGRIQTVRRDPDGNERELRRWLNNQPREAMIDWSVDPDASLEVESFAQITEYDALDRVTRQFHWHREAVGSPVTSHEPVYNERGILASESLTTRLRTSAAGIVTGPNTSTTQAIEQVRHNEKGQKTFLALGNGTLTQYEYDPATFRLKQIQTTRPANPTGFPARRSNLVDPTIVQQLLYAYDAVGNVTECRDDAYEPVYFQNQQVEARSRYEYDALYRLTRATGRENGALRGAPSQAEGRPVDTDFPIMSMDPNALRIYTETYAYDAVGNVQRVRHDAGLGSWTRDYAYAFEDPTQPASNRLWQTWVGGDRTQAVTYSHDKHGNTRNLARTGPRFNLRWDHRDMLRSLDLGGGGWAYYQYDSDKQRTRKRIDKQNGLGGYWERIYLGGYELYRRYNASGTAIVEEIESHHLFEGAERVLLVDDVITPSGAGNPRPDGRVVRGQTLFRYQYSNHLGSAGLELDEGGRLVSYEEYHPYGTSAYRAIKRGIEAPPKRYRFTGMERDEETGCNYHDARYYAPWLALWVSCDPAGLVDGPSLRTYSKSNPATHKDTNGRQTLHQSDPSLSAKEQLEVLRSILGEKKPAPPLKEWVEADPHLREEAPPRIELQKGGTIKLFETPAQEANRRRLRENRMVLEMTNTAAKEVLGGAVELLAVEAGLRVLSLAAEVGLGMIGEYFAQAGKTELQLEAGFRARTLPPALAEIEATTGSTIYDPKAAVEGGIDWRLRQIPEGFVGEAYGVEGKTRFQWLARVPEENLAMGATGNQLDLMKWYAKPDVGVDVYRYVLRLKEPAPAAMSKIAPQPGIPTLGPPKLQYFNPKGFEAYGEVVSKEWVGRLPPTSRGSL
jgi:RHS repeat-associated protein